MFGYWYAKRTVEDMYQFVAAALILRWFASTLPPLLVGISVPERACQAWLPFTSSSGYPTKTKHAFFGLEHVLRCLCQICYRPLHFSLQFLYQPTLNMGYSLDHKQMAFCDIFDTKSLSYFLLVNWSCDTRLSRIGNFSQRLLNFHGAWNWNWCNFGWFNLNRSCGNYFFEIL